MEKEPLVRVIRFRSGEASPYVGLNLPVSYLADPAHCQEVSDRLSRLGEGWEVRKATPDLGKQLPKRAGLYMFVWCPTIELVLDGCGSSSFKYVLYVGQAGASSTNNLSSRFQAEYSAFIGGDPEELWRRTQPKMKREDRLRKFLTVRPLEYWFLVMKNRSQIESLERRLIKLFNPPINQQSGARLRKVREEPAFG